VSGKLKRVKYWPSEIVVMKATLIRGFCGEMSPRRNDQRIDGSAWVVGDANQASHDYQHQGIQY
jgi:hypothetical protein